MAQRSKRPELSAAVYDQFYSRGYHGVGIRDITTAAGAPQGSFYNHYSTKEEAALEALARYGDPENYADLLERGEPPLPRLRRHFERIRDDNAARDYTRGCMLGNFATEVADHNTAVRDEIARDFGGWAAAIAGVLTEAAERGELRESLDPAAAARFLLNAWEGTLIDARVTKSEAAFTTYFTAVFDVYLAA